MLNFHCDKHWNDAWEGESWPNFARISVMFRLVNFSDISAMFPLILVRKHPYFAGGKVIELNV